jgi:hypothetical protein
MLLVLTIYFINLIQLNRFIEKYKENALKRYYSISFGLIMIFIADWGLFA